MAYTFMVFEVFTSYKRLCDDLSIFSHVQIFNIIQNNFLLNVSFNA